MSMRILQEIEKKYNSPTMCGESAKADSKYIMNHYKFKTKTDYITPTVLILGTILVILGIIMVFNVLIAGIVSVVLGVIAIIVGVFLLIKNRNVKKAEFLKYYGGAIAQNGKIKYSTSKAISGLYPVYIEVDNEMKTFKLIYQDKDIIFCEYDDILNYRLLINKKEIEETRLPDESKDTDLSYSLEITFNNKKKSEIIFYNENPLFKLNGKNVYSQKSNTKAINNLAQIMDMIIMKNIVNLEEI